MLTTTTGIGADVETSAGWTSAVSVLAVSGGGPAGGSSTAPFSRVRCPTMRICRFMSADGPHLGVIDGDEVIDVTAAAPDLPRDPSSLLDTDGRAALDAPARHRHARRQP